MPLDISSRSESVSANRERRRGAERIKRSQMKTAPAIDLFPRQERKAFHAETPAKAAQCSDDELGETLDENPQ
jgi:hypothetical protein